MVYNRHGKVKSISGKGSTKNVDWRGKIWSSNIFSVVLIVLLILSFVKVSKEVLLRYEINQEIKQLEQRRAELSDKAEEMDKLIAYLQTDEYIEKQARLQLNLSKPGEKQINLAGDSGNRTLDTGVDDSSNVIKWFNYFFK